MKINQLDIVTINNYYLLITVYQIPQYVVTEYYYVSSELDDSGLNIVGILSTYEATKELIQTKSQLMADSINKSKVNCLY